jgi:hypothetical protein
MENEEKKIFYTNSVNISATNYDLQMKMSLNINNIDNTKKVTLTVKDELTVVMSIEHAKKLQEALKNILDDLDKQKKVI